MSTISQNISQIHNDIQEASTINAFPEKITLVAVSKSQNFNKIIEAFDVGVLNFGENYLQEALDKKKQLEKFPIQWHFLGPIQSNKCKLIAENFSWVHSVDRIKVMKLLNDNRPSNLPPLNICIQINTSGEETKSGIPIKDAKAHLLELIQALKKLPKLKLRGIMSIPSNTKDTKQVIDEFKAMHILYSELKNEIATIDTLSMGMSSDFKLAIEYGSNLVRIGTAIFGARAVKTHGGQLWLACIALACEWMGVILRRPRCIPSSLEDVPGCIVVAHHDVAKDAIEFCSCVYQFKLPACAFMCAM